MTTPDLADLLDRVRSATGPSREIDQDIFCAFGLAPVSDDGMADAYRAPMYSASLDACAALQAEVLPGFDATISFGKLANLVSLYRRPNLLRAEPTVEEGHSDARLAWLSAIISAVQAVREAGQ